MIEDILDETGFWVLGGLGSIAVLIGYIASKKMSMVTLPIWQLLIILLGIWVASAFFVGRD